MLSGVSHDLKTPLTRMKLQLSMTQVEGAEDLLQDIEEMERMLEGYLSFAKGEGKEPMQKMDVSDLLTTIVEKLRKQGHDIDLHIEQRQELMLRSNDFVRAVSNVLMNAHRYAGQYCGLRRQPDHAGQPAYCPLRFLRQLIRN